MLREVIANISESFNINFFNKYNCFHIRGFIFLTNFVAYFQPSQKIRPKGVNLRLCSIPLSICGKISPLIDPHIYLLIRSKVKFGAEEQDVNIWKSKFDRNSLNMIMCCFQLKGYLKSFLKINFDFWYRHLFIKPKIDFARRIGLISNPNTASAVGILY